MNSIPFDSNGAEAVPATVRNLALLGIERIGLPIADVTLRTREEPGR